MKRELLDYLICPLSFSELELFVLEERDIFGSNEIVTGLLQSEDNREIIYPVINGIPRILPNALQQHLFSIRTFYDKVPENLRNIIEKEIQNSERKLDARFEHTQKSFTSEWAAMNACSFAWGRDIRERREMFLTNFCINDYSELRNKKILDVGCGHGEVEIAIINSGAEIFAVDMCFSVDDVYARLLKASEPETRKVHVLQSNAHALPFKSHVFDLVHSAGVLHHTPDTFKGFESITRTLKKKGMAFIEVYSNDHKNTFEKIYWMLYRDILKKITSRLPYGLLHILCYCLVPFMWLFTRSFNWLSKTKRYRRRSFREMELSLFDSFSPLYDWHHTSEQVEQWFKELGYTEIEKTFKNHNGIGYVGKLSAPKCNEP